MRSYDFGVLPLQVSPLVLIFCFLSLCLNSLQKTVSPVSSSLICHTQSDDQCNAFYVLTYIIHSTVLFALYVFHPPLCFNHSSTQTFVLSLLPRPLTFYLLLVFQDFFFYCCLTYFSQIFEVFSKTVLHIWNTLLFHPKRLLLFHILP